MVLITAKGNPRGIKKMSDLAKPGIRFTRVTGEKDLATRRTIDFVRNVTALEGNPQLAEEIIDGAIMDAAKPHTVPQTIHDVIGGKADAGIVYYSAAVEAKNDLDNLRFPATVNISSQIRNAATVPATAKEPAAAILSCVSSSPARAGYPRSDRPASDRATHHSGGTPSRAEVGPSPSLLPQSGRRMAKANRSIVTESPSSSVRTE